MLLWDPLLRFARDLIAHWTHIRRDGLVPFEEDLDPRVLLPSRSFIFIADLSRPGPASMEFVGAAVRRRYGRDIRKTDWFAFIVPEQRAAVVEAKRLLISVPCGRYYRFAVSVGGERVCEAESVDLPLRRRGETNPSLSIALSRDIVVKDVANATSAALRKVTGVFAEFVDIGAGAPAFPCATRRLSPAAR